MNQHPCRAKPRLNEPDFKDRLFATIASDNVRVFRRLVYSKVSGDVLWLCSIHLFEEDCMNSTPSENDSQFTHLTLIRDTKENPGTCINLGSLTTPLQLCFAFAAFKCTRWLLSKCNDRILAFSKSSLFLLHHLIHGCCSDLVSEEKAVEFYETVVQTSFSVKDLKLLYFEEDHDGWRPLELAFFHNLYKLGKSMLDTRQVAYKRLRCCGVMELRQYDCSEYESNLNRFSRSPMNILCHATWKKVYAIHESRIMDHPLIRAWSLHIWRSNRVRVLLHGVMVALVPLISILGMLFCLYPFVSRRRWNNSTHYGDVVTKCGARAHFVKLLFQNDQYSRYILNILCAVVLMVHIFHIFSSRSAFYTVSRSKLISMHSNNEELTFINSHGRLNICTVISFMTNVLFIVVHYLFTNDITAMIYLEFILDSAFVIHFFSFVVICLDFARWLPRNRGGCLFMLLCEALDDIFNCLFLMILALLVFATVLSGMDACNTDLFRFDPKLTNNVYLVFRLTINVVDLNDITMSRLQVFHFMLYVIVSMLIINFLIARMTTRMTDIYYMRLTIHRLVRLSMIQFLKRRYLRLLTHCNGLVKRHPQITLNFDVWVPRKA